MIMTKRDGEDFDGIGRLPNEGPATAGGVPVRQWHNAGPELDEPMTPAERATAIIDYLPDGPSLLYVHFDSGALDTRTFTQVDAIAVQPKGSQRDTKIERAVCRALLVHALQLLDEAEAGDDE
jgi:hypothetical protein